MKLKKVYSSDILIEWLINPRVNEYEICNMCDHKFKCTIMYRKMYEKCPVEYMKKERDYLRVFAYFIDNLTLYLLAGIGYRVGFPNRRMDFNKTLKKLKANRFYFWKYLKNQIKKKGETK